MRNIAPGATGFRNLKRWTAASSAEPIDAPAVAEPIMTAAVCATASIINTPGRMGRAGKCPAKMGFSVSTVSRATQRTARLQFLHPVDPQKGRTVRNDLLDFVSLHHFGFCTSKVSAGSFAFSDGEVDDKDAVHSALAVHLQRARQKVALVELDHQIIQAAAKSLAARNELQFVLAAVFLRGRW